VRQGVIQNHCLHPWRGTIVGRGTTLHEGERCPWPSERISPTAGAFCRASYMRLPNWLAHRAYQLWLDYTPLSIPVRSGPVSARSEDCTVLSQVQYNCNRLSSIFNASTTMSSDLQWHLLRVRETVFSTLLQLTLL
jgi:hypothetical protein